MFGEFERSFKSRPSHQIFEVKIKILFTNVNTRKRISIIRKRKKRRGETKKGHNLPEKLMTRMERIRARERGFLLFTSNHIKSNSSEKNHFFHHGDGGEKLRFLLASAKERKKTCIILFV
jgi:hypothetical protein